MAGDRLVPGHNHGLDDVRAGWRLRAQRLIEAGLVFAWAERSPDGRRSEDAGKRVRGGGGGKRLGWAEREGRLAARSLAIAVDGGSKDRRRWESLAEPSQRSWDE